MIDLENHVPVTLRLERKYRTYTLEEFLRKEAKSLDKHEFINGKIVKMPYAKGPHNIITISVASEIRFALKTSETIYHVFGSDQMVYFPSLQSGVYADALAVCEKAKYWDDNELLLINPLLVVEVLSKSTSAYDRAGKFDKYKTLESFKEYVLVAQDKCYVEVWYQLKKGFWQESIYEDINEKVHFQSIDIQIDMKEIYRNIEFKI
jgi:Uma2 family endonuclease